MMEAGHTKFNPDWHFGLWKVGQGLNYGTLSSMVPLLERVYLHILSQKI